MTNKLRRTAIRTPDSLKQKHLNPDSCRSKPAPRGWWAKPGKRLRSRRPQAGLAGIRGLESQPRRAPDKGRRVRARGRGGPLTPKTNWAVRRPRESPAPTPLEAPAGPPPRPRGALRGPGDPEPTSCGADRGRPGCGTGPCAGRRRGSGPPHARPRSSGREARSRLRAAGTERAGPRRPPSGRRQPPAPLPPASSIVPWRQPPAQVVINGRAPAGKTRLLQALAWREPRRAAELGSAPEGKLEVCRPRPADRRGQEEARADYSRTAPRAELCSCDGLESRPATVAAAAPADWWREAAETQARAAEGGAGRGGGVARATAPTAQRAGKPAVACEVVGVARAGIPALPPPRPAPRRLGAPARAAAETP